jgi:hypothetical protein
VYFPTRSSYVIPFTVTNPTAVPFLQLATPANAGIAILEMFLGQEASETSEQTALNVIRRTTASTLPTAATINQLDPTGPTTRLNSATTTNAFGIASVTGTAGATLKRWTFNTLNGLLYVPAPEARIVMDISQFLTFQFAIAPAANVFDGYIALMEL